MNPTTLPLAVRNITHDWHRSSLTVSAIAIGLAALIFLWGFSDALHDSMLGNFQNTLLGSLQVHRQGYFRHPRLARDLGDAAPEIRAVRAAGVEAWTTRLESFVLAAGERTSTGVMLMALDPEREPHVTRIAGLVGKGRFFRPGDGPVCILGAGTARQLGVGLGDPVVLVGYDRYGGMVADAFTLVGVLAGGEMGIDQGLALAPLGAVQDLLEMQGRVTSVVARVASDRLEAVARRVRSALDGTRREVLRWYDMFPVVREWITLHNGFLYVFQAVVLLIVLAGVLNTILLSMIDRVHEIGILMALGNRQRSIAAMIVVESLLIGGAGVLAGTLLGVALVGLSGHIGLDLSDLLGPTNRFYVDPVIRPRLDTTHLSVTVAAVLVTTVLSGVYPAWRAARLEPVEAMRDE